MLVDSWFWNGCHQSRDHILTTCIPDCQRGKEIALASHVYFSCGNKASHSKHLSMYQCQWWVTWPFLVISEPGRLRNFPLFLRDGKEFWNDFSLAKKKPTKSATEILPFLIFCYIHFHSFLDIIIFSIFTKMR